MARTTLQTADLIGAFPLTESKRAELVEIAFAVQTRLLACRDVLDELNSAIADAIESVGPSGVKAESDGRLVTIPGVPDLQARVESFLYQAKLAVRDIGKLYNPLLGQHFKENFKAFADWALTKWGASDPLVVMLESDRGWIGRVIGMRDSVEHPTHRRGPLRVRNFTLGRRNDETILVPPTWGHESERPVLIAPEMEAIVSNLLHLYEDLLSGLLLKLEGADWLQVVEIPEEQRDPVSPMRLRAVPRIMPLNGRGDR